MICISIDVTLLDKARFKSITRKNGKAAVFCDLVLFETDNDYGDYIVKQGVSKDERANKVQMPILGNGKIIGKGGGGQPSAPAGSDAGEPPF